MSNGNIHSSVFVLVHCLGVLHIVHALLHRRTAEGATAWMLALIIFPYVAIPLYWIFGPQKFEVYSNKLAAVAETFDTLLHERVKEFEQQGDQPAPSVSEKRQRMLERIADWPLTSGNSVKLLTEGEKTFSRMFDAIRSAEEYVLVQFYILRNDRLGAELKELLLERAAAGVRVFVLFDRIGSFFIGRDYITALKVGGVHVHEFRAARGLLRQFRINFRNHRKLVVVDGVVGFVGGFNIGDEYLGLDPNTGHWRDTHAEIRGPCVLGLQRSFLKDWYWMEGTLPDLRWSPVATRGGVWAVPVPTGPTTMTEEGTMVVLDAITAAQDRFWISSPYFVPDTDVLSALQLAAIRGVDVRILLPERSDHTSVHLAGLTFEKSLLEHGVKIFRYQTGFLHQKAFLVDEEAVYIGSSNLDNRSLQLNFEVGILVFDQSVNQQVEALFENDFVNSRFVETPALEEQGIFSKVVAHFCRLFSPLL